MPSYLQLCIETWRIYLPQHKVWVIDYDNLDEILGVHFFDKSILVKLPLAMQKDAIMVAILQQRGGVFMDADTIAVRSLGPICERLRQNEVVMFGAHCAFIAARPKSKLLGFWLQEIHRRMHRISSGEERLDQLRWDFIGNAALDCAQNALLAEKKLIGMIRGVMVSLSCVLREWAGVGSYAPFRDFMMRAANSIDARSKNILLKSFYRQNLAILSPVDDGFISEGKIFKGKGMGPKEKYIRFWFGNHLDVQYVFSDKQAVIGLHNSWTPQWYKDLSRADVLRHHSLLSRTIRHLQS